MGSPVRIKKICEPFAMGGNKVITFSYFSGPLSYTTGGDLITAKDVGLTWINAVFVAPDDTGANLGIPVFAASGDVVDSILFKIASIAGVEVGNGTDQTAKKFRVTIIGTY